MNLKLQSIASICLFLAFSATANQRLGAVEGTYYRAVDAHVQKQVEKTLKQYASLISKYSSESIDEFKQLASEFEESINDPSIDESLNNYQDYLKVHRDLRTQHAEREDQVAALGVRVKKLKSLLRKLNKESACRSSVLATVTGEAPQYQLDERIDTSGIPEPREFGMNALIGSEIEAADSIEKNLYLPATTGGCVAGQFIIPIPILGCIIGAVVGSAASYGVGKASTAIITASENKKERQAYELAVNQETAKQKQEIENARSFINEHPIDEAMLATKAEFLCFEQDFSFLDEHFADAESWLSVLDSLKNSIAEEKRASEQQLSKLRDDAIDDQKRLNDQIALNTQAALLSVFEAAKQDVAVSAIRRSLISCLSEAFESCEESVLCIDEADAALEDKGEAFDNLRSNIRAFRNKMASCSKTGAAHDR